MPRRPRQDHPGATHHVFVRAVNRSVIAVDDADYEHALVLLDRTVSRFELRCHASCHMPNHSHLLVTSELGNLSKAMHWLGTCSAQSFNKRHKRSGHLYQGRFGSRLVKDDRYFRELARYLPLNPVRAGLCTAPEEWPWSTYASTTGLRKEPEYLDSGVLLSAFSSVAAYADWVAEGFESTFLDEDGIPVPPAKPSLASLVADNSDRAIANAHFHYGYSQAAIARHFGVSRSQIARRLD